MRRLLQLTASVLLLGAGEDLRYQRFDVAQGKPPARGPRGPCFEDGAFLDFDQPLKAPADAAVTKSGCLRIRMSKGRTETWSFRTPDGGGPPRAVMTQVQELHGAWLVEAVDGDRDGYLEHVTLHEFDDAGQWRRQLALDRSPDGGFLELLEKSIASPEQFLIEKSQWRDGGWVQTDRFQSAQVHGAHQAIQELKPH